MLTASTPISSRPAQSLRVLVVDDNLDTGRGVAEYFNWKGHSARSVGTGREALRHASNFRPELVLLDLGVSDVPGTEVGRQLRDNPTARAPVITGIAHSESFYLRQRCAEVGFDYFLMKPVSANEYDYLLSVADKKRHLTETFFDRKREHDAAFYAFVLGQLQFGELILDYASRQSDTAGREPSFERVNRIADLATVWLGRANSLSSDQLTRVFMLTGELRRRLHEMDRAAGE
jgi:DNA-binding response OmpR family regulator